MASADVALSRFILRSAPSQEIRSTIGSCKLKPYSGYKQLTRHKNTTYPRKESNEEPGLYTHILLGSINDVQYDKCDDYMWSNSNAICWKSSVEFEESLFLKGLCSTIDRSLVGQCAIRIWRHLLHSCFHKIKWQGAGCCEKTSDHGSSQYDWCATSLISSILSNQLSSLPSTAHIHYNVF